MHYRRFMIAMALGMGCLVAGCGKEDMDTFAARTIADTKLSDAEAIEQLAKRVFNTSEGMSITELDGGEIALTVTVHPSTEGEVKTLRGGPSAAEMDSRFVLVMTIFDGREMVEYGRQRNLARLTIKVKHTLLDETGNKVDVDIFGYTLSKDSFDAYLTTGDYAEILRGKKALETIEKTCVIDYNYFDQITYTPNR